MSKLSIIVPVYQVKAYIERCLQSILFQSYVDYEVILVDDGSTDGSQDICDEYACQYDRISVIHKQNRGLSSARNVGLEAATGDYIMFIDSDDLIHSRTIELELALLEKYNAEAAICSLKRFSRDEEIVINSPVNIIEDVLVLSGREVEKRFFNNPKSNMYVSSCGKVFKRELFEDIRFPEGRLFEDEYTTFKIYYKCNNVVVIDRELYFYYINESGITQNLNLKKRFDEYDAQEERIKYYKEVGDIELYHLALLEFLKTAQWDLKNLQSGKGEYSLKRGRNFQTQYLTIFKQAEQESLVSFVSNYDYYVLAYPKKKTVFRLKRQALRAIGKMD